MRVIYFVHGRGRGHASRALSILPRLQSEGYEVLTYAGRDAYELLKGKENVKSVDSILPNSSLLSFVRRFYQDRQVIKAYQPDVLISDGDAPCTYAAKLFGCSIISIGHALIFPYCQHPFQLDRSGLVKENFKVKMAASLADKRFAVHFTKVSTHNDHTLVVRPDFDLSHEPYDSQDYLLSYFRDGNGLPFLKRLVSQGIRIKNFGQKVNLEGVENYPVDTERFKETQKNAKGIVASAGSNLIFESIAMRKPMFLVYKPDDFEQMTNVKYVEHENLGFGAPVVEWNTNKLDRFVEQLKRPEILTHSLQEMPVLTEELIRYMDELRSEKSW